ncbi:MAG: hypothetical protein HZB21_00410, partial [Deltaproteobacteria bacterium]|nr:hypothetical protein [Deltaproteobacteria bacterium]
MGPLQGALLGSYNSVTGVMNDYLLLISVNKDNDALKHTVTALQDENARLKEEVRLHGRLKDILDYKDGAPFDTIA